MTTEQLLGDLLFWTGIYMLTGGVVWWLFDRGLAWFLDRNEPKDKVIFVREEVRQAIKKANWELFKNKVRRVFRAVFVWKR